MSTSGYARGASPGRAGACVDGSRGGESRPAPPGPSATHSEHSRHGRCLTVHRSPFFILRQYLDGCLKQCFTVCTHRLDTVQDPQTVPGLPFVTSMPQVRSEGAPGLIQRGATESERKREIRTKATAGSATRLLLAGGSTREAPQSRDISVRSPLSQETSVL